MDLEDRGSAPPVGWLQCDSPVEAPWPQQSLVEDIGTVGRGQDDHSLAGLEAIHLGQDLVEGLLLLVVPADAQARAPAAADGIQLVDEDDRRRCLARLQEKIAHPRCADSDDRFNEFGGRLAEERDLRFARHGASEKCLPCSRRPDQQDTLRHHAP